jgi:hypothetical protein
MKRLALLLAITLSLLAISACRFSLGTVKGSGVRKTEKRDLSGFKAIDMQGALGIQVTCQKPESFEIEGDDNLLSLVQSEVRDGVLYLKTEKGFSSEKGIIARISMPSLDRIKNTGAGEFRVEGLKNEKFEVRSTGAATVIASGQAKNVEIRDTGAGSIDLHNLHAEKVNVSSSGASQVDVYASEQLDVSASGAGGVTYSGDPKIVNKHLAGAATLSRRESSVN